MNTLFLRTAGSNAPYRSTIPGIQKSNGEQLNLEWVIWPSEINCQFRNVNWIHKYLLYKANVIRGYRLFSPCLFPCSQKTCSSIFFKIHKPNLAGRQGTDRCLISDNTFYIQRSNVKVMNIKSIFFFVIFATKHYSNNLTVFWLC